MRRVLYVCPQDVVEYGVPNPFGRPSILVAFLALRQTHVSTCKVCDVGDVGLV